VVDVRRDKINYYLDIAQVVAERSTCLRRKFGSIIVSNDEIVSTGYNGAPRGRENCDELNYCLRDKLDIPRGERYEICRSVHSEPNAIMSAGRKNSIGASLYMVGINAKSAEIEAGTAPCMMCKRICINAGIKEVIVREPKDKYTVYKVSDWVKDDESMRGEFGY